MASARSRTIAAALLARTGSTYAEDAGIRLSDKPSPLFRLLTLTMLLSKPITAEVAVHAARELAAAGYRSPKRMSAASWQQRVDALGRAHYRRYDESMSTQLGQAADFVLAEYAGDLRRLAGRADSSVARAAELLAQVPGIGPTGAHIFLREVQAVWCWVRPYSDAKVAEAARALGLPHTTAGLRDLVGDADLSRLSAALIRSGRDKDLAEYVTR